MGIFRHCLCAAALAAVLLCVGAGCTHPDRQEVQVTPAVTPTPVPTPEPTPQHFTLTFAGDCTLGGSESSYYAQCGYIKTIDGDYRYPFQNVIGYFENDDCSMVNLEGVLADKSTPVTKKFVFRGPTDYVNILTQNSVEAVSIANNHTMDHGKTGYESTVTTLTEAGVAFARQDTTLIFTTDSGLTIGVYAVTLGYLDEEKICAGVAALDANEDVDVVILAAHWGVENAYRPTAAQQSVGRAAIDAGADIVYGTHPHVLQPIEEYNGGIIYYSLGNFTFGGNGDPKDYDTAILQQEIIRDPDGTVRLGELTVIPCSVSSLAHMNDFRPTPYRAGSAEYERTMSKLNGTYAGGNLPWG